MIITHNTGKAELCFVKVPDGANNFELTMLNYHKQNYDDNLAILSYSFNSISCHIKKDGPHVLIPSGNWQIVGNPFELSQEVIKDLVPEMRDSGFPFEVQEITDTWKDILDKWGIYQTNPIPKPDINHEKYFPISDDDKDTMFVRDWDKWEDAEERTGNWILLRNI